MTQAANLATVGSNANSGGTLITSGTAQASTSGTSIDFTGIPAWVKRVTVMFNGVSTNSNDDYLVQIGAGSVTTSGYVTTETVFYSTSLLQNQQFTNGWHFNNSAGTGDTVYGALTINLFGSNTWVGNGSIASNSRQTICAGGVVLGGTLDRVRITTANGTNTFDAGSINILYE